MLGDDILSAYLDGELDAEQRLMVEQRLQADKGAAVRLERMRSSDTLLRQALQAKTQVKDRRLATMILEPRARVRSPLWATRYAQLAAALAFGVLLGQLPRLGAEDTAPFSLSAQESRLLDTMASAQSVDTPRGVFEVALSLQTATGPCREFRLSEAAHTTAVLACRDDGDGWRMIAAATAPRAGGYVPAGANSVIDSALAERGSVSALDEVQERAQIARGWR